jgi:prolyl-tRNA editing enzyme YbaK/EbsC (Cys-tRNA(Pro) deacylase)
MPILPAIRACLARAGVPYQELHHEPTLTSAASARARGEDLGIGGKALVLKIGEQVALFVLSAACKLDSAAIKTHFGVKKLRFVSAAELHELTGLVPGAVPPFGAPILPLALYVDPSILANRRIAFNAGSLTDSIIMAVDDYIRVAQPTVLRFAMTEPTPASPSERGEKASRP